jgi:hypothetical protein
MNRKEHMNKSLEERWVSRERVRKENVLESRMRSIRKGRLSSGRYEIRKPCVMGSFNLRNFYVSSVSKVSAQKM